MLQQLLTMIPRNPPIAAALWVAIGGAVVGLILLLAGSRVSHYLVTLLMVAAGAMLGKLLPARMGWTVDPMGPTVGGALVFGVLGYVLHRLWLGIGLGTALGIWSALALWCVVAPGQTWTWPTTEGATFGGYSAALWTALPDGMRALLPYAAGLAFASGICCMLLWPRLGTALFYSVLGASLLLMMGLAAVEMRHQSWVDALPRKAWAQLSFIGALLLVGMFVQWRLMPAPTTRIELPTKSKEPEGE